MIPSLDSTRVYQAEVSFFHVVMFLTPFANSAQSLALTIEDKNLFDISTIEAGSFSVRTCPTDLTYQWQQCIESSKSGLKLCSLSYAFSLLGLREKSHIRTCHLHSRASTPNVAVLAIDCSEIFIDTPSSYAAHSKTYSDYRKHNTVKFLIGITPCGSICFLSWCWGGCVSDKSLTQQSGFFSYVEPGDVVLGWLTIALQ